MSRKSDPFKVVRDFEAAVAEYTGAPHVVAVNSCTSALLLAVAWCLRDGPPRNSDPIPWDGKHRAQIEIPKRTYLSVPMSIIHAGGRPVFVDLPWIGKYRLCPLPVWDSARLFTSGMHVPGQMECTSHHWQKTLGIQQGGCILLDDPEAAAWLRRARFDGRTEGVAPKDDHITQVGWHCYMSPEVAALGLVRMASIPEHNDPLPNDDYPDLSTMEIFK